MKPRNVKFKTYMWHSLNVKQGYFNILKKELQMKKKCVTKTSAHLSC